MLAAACAWEQNSGTAPGLWLIRIAGQVVQLASPADELEITEEGPGGVSQLLLTVDDPGLAYTFGDGDPVEVHDVANDRPMFRGFVKRAERIPFGLGRQILVRATGAETLLDWLVVPAVTFDTAVISWTVQSAIQALAAQAFGIGVPLNALGNVSAQGTQAEPVGAMGLNLLHTFTTPAGTLREAIAAVYAASSRSGSSGSRPVATIDLWGGLRTWCQLSSAGALQSSDYATLTVVDTAPFSGAGAFVAPKHVIDGTDVVRAVYVVGGNAAGTGVVSDDSGIPGPTAILSDSSLLTAEARDAAAAAYLAEHQVAERGRGTLEQPSITTNVRAGSRLQFTDAQLGQSGALYPISAITKRIRGGTLTWDVTYGKLPPSAMRQARRLTRNVLN